MKKILFIILLLSLSIGHTIESKDFEGVWYRSYSVYLPWTDSNQGTVAYYKEELHFQTNNKVFVYDGNDQSVIGKSLYTLMEKDNEDYIVFYAPDQDPNTMNIQSRQGYFIYITTNNQQEVLLNLMTMKEHNKSKKREIYPGVIYKKKKFINNPISYISPQN